MLVLATRQPSNCPACSLNTVLHARSLTHVRPKYQAHVLPTRAHHSCIGRDGCGAGNSLHSSSACNPKEQVCSSTRRHDVRLHRELLHGHLMSAQQVSASRAEVLTQTPAPGWRLCGAAAGCEVCWLCVGPVACNHATRSSSASVACKQLQLQQ